MKKIELIIKQVLFYTLRGNSFFQIIHYRYITIYNSQKTEIFFFTLYREWQHTPADRTLTITYQINIENENVKL